MLCFYSIESNNKPSAEQVEACNNTSSFSPPLNSLRWARQKPKEYKLNLIQCRLRRFAWFLLWHHCLKLEKEMAGKSFQCGKKNPILIELCYNHICCRHNAFSHCVITPPVSKSQFSDRPVHICSDCCSVMSLCPRVTPATVMSENGAPPTVGCTL